MTGGDRCTCVLPGSGPSVHCTGDRGSVSAIDESLPTIGLPIARAIALFP